MASSWQRGSVCISVIVNKGGAGLICQETVVSQPLSSIIVRVYVPATSPEIFDAVGDVLIIPPLEAVHA